MARQKSVELPLREGDFDRPALGSPRAGCDTLRGLSEEPLGPIPVLEPPSTLEWADRPVTFAAS